MSHSINTYRVLKKTQTMHLPVEQHDEHEKQV
jgi:hypothetical protein